MNIMVIDDSPEIVRMVSEMLRGAGHAVRGFTQPNDLLAALTSAVDMVISDIDMTPLNGFALAEAVAARIGFAPPRTLLMSGEPHADGMRIAPYKSVLGLLPKPFMLRDFLRVIAALQQARASCPCRIKGLISCPEVRANAEQASPEKITRWCASGEYAGCPDYAALCGQRLRDWISKSTPPVQ